jgi:hypothetical protein
MLYFAYLDEFGHIGPYVARDDARYNTSPVFGLGGIILPSSEVRKFGTWFFQMKSRLLKFEIDNSGVHPATWEKKGSSLYTTRNIEQYRELRVATNRLLNKIEAVGGHTFYLGLQKTAAVADHNPRKLYVAVLRAAMRKLNNFCEKQDAEVMVVMDEHQDRAEILTAASQAMYGNYFTNIIEPPFQVESHRYQTVQCADWVCGLIGRLAANQVRPDEYEEFAWAEKYFGERIRRVSTHSTVRQFNIREVATGPLAIPTVQEAIIAQQDVRNVEGTTTRL